MDICGELSLDLDLLPSFPGEVSLTALFTSVFWMATLSLKFRQKMDNYRQTCSPTSSSGKAMLM